MTRAAHAAGDPDWLAVPCPSPCPASREAAAAHQARLTKPAGALGVLEDLAVRLAALQRRPMPRADIVPVIVFAGDHGVTQQGISPYPSSVTVAMLANFVAGGAAISVLARTLGLPLYVVDAGTLATAPMVGVHVDKPRCGTADFSLEPAMSTSDLDHALAAGRRAIERWALGADLVILGEMGIGNSTAAAAVAAALLGREGHEVAGAGTGLDAQGVVRKAALVTSALARHGLARRAGGAVSADVSRILATVGGLEIAALAGAIVRAGQAGVPVLVDGFIVTVAALAAVRLQPSVSPWLIFSHRSAEQGHAAVLDALGAQPVVALGLRLGEASGAASVLPLVRLACALHAEMATFEAAGIAGPVA